tara:strand:+ start:7324 stop:7722 length:399 start_codon:yes stop_codon:yes gene_type:complete
MMMIQKTKRTSKYLTKLYLKTDEGREFLRDLLSRKLTDAQLATLYDFNETQVKRARHKHGVYYRNCPGLRKIEKREEVVEAEEVVPRPTRSANTHSICIQLSPDEMEKLATLAENECRSVSNQAKWILRNAI